MNPISRLYPINRSRLLDGPLAQAKSRKRTPSEPRDNMAHIHAAGGRFVTVLPRSRLEDGEFRKWIQTHAPDWEVVWDRPHPRDQDAPRDVWSVHQPALPSAEV